MSSSDQVLNTGQQATTNYETAKIFVYNNRFDKGTFKNWDGDSVTLEAGTVLGRVNATGRIAVLDSGASDGSQYPIGILNQTWTVESDTEQEMFYCVSGDVSEEKVVFATYGDDMATIVDGRTLRDRIGSDTVGINLVAGTDLTGYDNN